VSFIDTFKGYREKDGLPWRVGPICKVLNSEYGISIGTSAYYGFKNRSIPARVLRDNMLKERILEIHRDNYSCYGARKLWRQLLKDDASVARCTVERLMRQLGLCGAVRGKVKKTTIASHKDICASDLVQRVFSAPVPDNLWVADFTYVPTREGWCYTSFVTDVFARRILGWGCSARMNQELVSDAFRTAVFARMCENRNQFKDLIHHNDKGSQYTSGDFIELLALHGIRGHPLVQEATLLIMHWRRR